MRSYKSLLVFSNLIVLFIFIRAQCAYAVVNIDTTRIVFNEEVSSQSFRLKNTDNMPALVQLWTDDGNPLSSPDTVKTPVIALPPVSKMFSHEMRSYRLILTSRESLKLNEESLLWLNIYQIPLLPEIQSLQDKQIILPLRIRIKVFVRPKGLKAPTVEDYERVKFRNKNGMLVIDNPTPWFITLNYRMSRRDIFHEALVPPNAQLTQEVTELTSSNGLIHYQIIDDIGVGHYFSKALQ